MDRLSDDRVREYATLPYQDDVRVRPVSQGNLRSLALEVLALRCLVTDAAQADAAFARCVEASEPKE